MEIQKVGVAGTMESSDIMVTVSRGSGKGIQIDLVSSVEKEFGKKIRRSISETAEQLGIQDAKVRAVDKGALDCTIRARVKTAIYRACDEKKATWERVK